MNLEWRERLVDRLIKASNGDATIKDYMGIVEEEGEVQELTAQELKDSARIIRKTGIKTVATINSRS